MKKLFVLLCFVSLSFASINLPIKSASTKSITIATSNTTIATADPTIVYRYIRNMGTITVNMSFVSPAITTTGIVLKVGEIYEINDANFYNGAIYGICTPSAGTIYILNGKK